LPTNANDVRDTPFYFKSPADDASRQRHAAIFAPLSVAAAADATPTCQIVPCQAPPGD